jgi:hypothetical protein
MPRIRAALRRQIDDAAVESAESPFMTARGFRLQAEGQPLSRRLFTKQAKAASSLVFRLKAEATGTHWATDSVRCVATRGFVLDRMRLTLGVSSNETLHLPRQMLYAIKRLAPGLGLIVSASAILLLSDLGHRVGSQSHVLRVAIIHDFGGAEKQRLRADDLLNRFDDVRRAEQLGESAAEMLQRLYV